MRRWLRILGSSLVGLCLAILLSTWPVVAQQDSFLPVLKQSPLEFPEKSPTKAPIETKPLKNPDELQSFMDSLLDEELKNAAAPGVVISVVKDGEIFWAKGYGYADIEKKAPVIADKTLFRVASLSKLFTITGAMQLYQKGLIDLNDDVSQYLDFQLDNPHSAPVTFAQMMTHTDGSTKRRIGLAARTEAELEPLANHLPDHMPAIFWPPGDLYSYSSYSIALLGYLIEKVANTPFISYIDQNILQPLDMKRSTFRQPPPPELANDLAVGYQKQGNHFEPVPYLYLNIYPGGGFQATATDMAHFMIAHLQLGRYQDQRILEPDIARLMHVTQFTHYPNLPGTSYGFRERLVNNIRTIGHLGSLRGYSSSMTLVPESNVGIFIASNSFSGVHGKIISQFFDRYFPASETSPETLTPESVQEKVDLSKYTGYYRDVEYPRETAAKLAGLFKQIQIIENDQNGLTIQTPNLLFRGKSPPRRLVPVDVPLFRRVGDNALTAFGEDGNGNMFAFNPLYPKLGAYVRVAWYETPWVQLGWLGLCVIFFLSACIAWLIRPFWQRLRGKSFKVTKEKDWPLKMAGFVGLLNLIFLISLPLSLWLIGVWKLAYGVPTIILTLLCLPIVSTALTLILAITTIIIWSQGRCKISRRLHYSFVTLAALLFIFLLNYWNLLGFQF